MPIRLPPLSSLRFFEAAGRRLSFKLAAKELSVTPSAVSHGIVTLERALGVELFKRDPAGLSLTAHGADYLPYVREALCLISEGMERIGARRSEGAVRITCAPTFASRWLMPRLPSFSEAAPRAAVTVDTSSRQVDLPIDGFDFAIRMRRAPLAEPGWRRLFGERLVPVCSPAYLAAHGGSAGTVDLRRARLIHVTPASEDWGAWLDSAGISSVALTGGLRFDTIQMAFDAAVSGMGVVIGRRPLVDQDIASGALVAAHAHEAAAESAYWLVSADGVERRPELTAFRDWLLGAAAPFDTDPPEGV